MIENFAVLAESENPFDREIAYQLALGDPELVRRALESGRLHDFPVAVGEVDGDICGRKGCNGVIVGKKFHGSCSCHLGHAPCGWCTSGCMTCSKCDFEEIYHV